MKPVRSIKNQYRGINAHLHSFWQAKHKWNRFHNVHIAHLVAMLKAKLLPMGYTAVTEEALQIRRIGDDLMLPRSDIIIRDKDIQRAMMPVVETLGKAYPVKLHELLEDDEDLEHPYFAIAIYERNESDLGMPVAWIELLSPSNKGDSRDALAYRNKRRQLVRSGLVFVELDYLNETPATFWRFGDYTRNEAGAHPYRIIILDPRPELEDGDVYLKEFNVDESIPFMSIPLSGSDQLTFDFDAAYQKTFEEMLYGLDEVDYSLLPLNFERYSEADRTRIANRMLAVLKAVQDGVDLEANAPLPIEDVPLESALEQIKQMVA